MNAETVPTSHRECCMLDLPMRWGAAGADDSARREPSTGAALAVRPLPVDGQLDDPAQQDRGRT